jgi:Tfp pilus assembly PilM family ATPase
MSIGIGFAPALRRGEVSVAMEVRMLGFVRHFVPHRGLPIGVDFGAGMMRLAQVAQLDSELKLVHADAYEVPADVAHDDSARSAFFVQTLRRALKSGPFLGRQAAVAIAPSLLHIKHVRVPKSNDAQEQTANAREQVVQQLGGGAVEDWYVRNVIAGDVFGESTPLQEAVVFATPQDTINQLLEDANAAKVELVGVQVQPRTVTESFGHFYRRKADADAVNLFVDLGTSGTRAIVAAPIDIKFVRAMSVTVGQVHERIAAALRMSVADASVLRRQTIAQQTGRSNDIPAVAPTLSDPQVRLQQITEQESRKIADELELCRRYYESMFSAAPITRLVFVGGGARDRMLCAAIAQLMGLPAQIGDPLIRFNRSALPSLACIDRREPQPEWAVAIGLSLCGRSAAVTA